VIMTTVCHAMSCRKATGSREGGRERTGVGIEVTAQWTELSCTYEEEEKHLPTASKSSTTRTTDLAARAKPLLFLRQLPSRQPARPGHAMQGSRRSSLSCHNTDYYGVHSMTELARKNLASVDDIVLW
jgi:hypothetical protein